jgi:hypothetical protein
VKTETQKLDQLADWLGEATAYAGRAGDDTAVIAGHVVVATVRGGGGPLLEVYDPGYAVRWHDRIVDYLKSNPDCELYDAVEASRPK